MIFSRTYGVDNEEASRFGEWQKIPKPKPVRIPLCDLCAKKAVWEHPLGGKRCADCPRPNR